MLEAGGQPGMMQDISRNRHRQVTGSCTFEVSIRPKCLEAEAAYYKSYKQRINTNIKLHYFIVLYHPLSSPSLSNKLFLVFFDVSRERNYISSIFR